MKFKMIYLWLALPVAIVILWIFAFYVPFSSFIEKQNKELGALQHTRETVEISIRDLLEVRKRDALARSSLDGMSKSMPLYHQFPTVMKMVAELGKKEGLVFESLSSILLPNDTQQPPSLIKPFLDISLKGRFLDVGKFLENVENQKGYNRIADGKLSYADKDYPVLTGKFLIEFRAWKGEYSR